MKLPTIAFAASALLALAACNGQAPADNSAENGAAPTENGAAPTENATGDKPADNAAAAPADNAAAPAGDKPEGAVDPASEPAGNEAGGDKPAE